MYRIPKGCINIALEIAVCITVMLLLTGSSTHQNILCSKSAILFDAMNTS